MAPSWIALDQCPGSRCRSADTGRRRPTGFFFSASAQVASTERTPGASTATGFSAKTCLPASTAALRWSGRKCGGVRQQHHVDAAGDHLLVGVEADEAVLGADIDLAGDGLVLLEQGQARFQAIGEGVGHGHELDVLVGLQGLSGRAGAAAAAADQADL